MSLLCVLSLFLRLLYCHSSSPSIVLRYVYLFSLSRLVLPLLSLFLLLSFSFCLISVFYHCVLVHCRPITVPPSIVLPNVSLFSFPRLVLRFLSLFLLLSLFLSCLCLLSWFPCSLSHKPSSPSISILPYVSSFPHLVFFFLFLSVLSLLCLVSLFPRSLFLHPIPPSIILPHVSLLSSPPLVSSSPSAVLSVSPCFPKIGLISFFYFLSSASLIVVVALSFFSQ